MRKREVIKSILCLGIILSTTACVNTPNENFVKQKEAIDYKQDGNKEEKDNKNNNKEKNNSAEENNYKEDELENSNGTNEDTPEAMQESTNDNNAQEANGLMKQLQAQDHVNCNVDYDVDDIHIVVDADVHIPDVDKIPLVRLKRTDFGGNDMEPYTKLFFGNNKVIYENGSSSSLDEENLGVVKGSTLAGESALMRILSYVENSSVAFYTDKYRSGGIFLPVSKINIPEDAKNICKYTEDEAMQLVQEYLDQMEGTKDYQLQEIKYSYNEETKEISAYQLYYKRVYKGIAETYDMTELNFDEKNAYVPFGYDIIQFSVDDSGVSFFDWENRLLPEEEVQESTKLLTFDEIMRIFKQQVRYSTAMGEYMESVGGDFAFSTADSAQKGMNTTIYSITLGYMRVHEKSKDGYMLIPVWDFQGEFHNGQSILTINAMDGSIVDRRVGY